MTTEAELVTRIREGLSLDESYEDSIIPAGLARVANRLLRDYHFPWAVARETYSSLSTGQQTYSLPTGFKKELHLRFYDTADECWTDALLKREGFTLPNSDNTPKYYWLEDGNLHTDIKIPAEAAANTELVLWYESMSWDFNKWWMIDRFEDLLYTFAVFRIAAERGKKEIAEIFGALWADDRMGLAIYLNELQFDNSIFMQREAKVNTAERYPTAGTP